MTTRSRRLSLVPDQARCMAHTAGSQSSRNTLPPHSLCEARKPLCQPLCQLLAGYVRWLREDRPMGSGDANCSPSQPVGLPHGTFDKFIASKPHSCTHYVRKYLLSANYLPGHGKARGTWSPLPRSLQVKLSRQVPAPPSVQ